MAYDHKVCRVTISGTAFGGTEIWSTGFFLGWEGIDSAVPTTQGAADVLLAWEALFEDTDMKIMSSYSTTQVKLASIAIEGNTILDEVVYAYPGTAIVGTQGTVRLPAQISLAATLTSDEPRGLASKGRMFLPGIAIMPDTTGHIPSGDVSVIADTVDTFFTALRSDADLPGQPILASNAGTDSVLTVGRNRYITGIRVGNVFDTQRRRRNSLAEVYTNRAVA